MEPKRYSVTDKLEQLAKEDMQYQQMLLDMRPMEKRYNSVLSGLSSEDQNAICDFVSQCEGMSFRMLELALALAENTPPE